MLAAAADIRPRWIMQLDADERLDADDALALRSFLANHADPGYGYEFQVFRMIGDRNHWDQATVWYARLFSFELGQSFPTQALHFRQLPTSIPSNRTLRTTLRIQHLAGLTEGDRQARFRKYQEADPLSVYQPNYTSLLKGPGVIHEWERRPPELPVVCNGCGEPLRITSPAMTAVVIAQDDADTIKESLVAIDRQQPDVDLELVVVVSGSADTAEAARRSMPDADVVDLEQSILPGEARNIGLTRARGSIITFPGSHVRVSPGSFAARLAAHQRGYAMVTGTILNGTDTFAGWAAYFLEHAQSLPGLPAEELSFAPGNCSYSRATLEWAGDFPAWRSAEDTAVNQRLFARGYGAYRDPAIEFVHRNPCFTIRDFVRHQRIRGRGLGRIMKSEDASRLLPTRARVRNLALAMMPAARMYFVGRYVWRSRQRSLQLRFALVSPLVATGAVVAWVQALLTWLNSYLRSGTFSQRWSSEVGRISPH
jgi:glycosyltransferase involved in cell wall biosynthesis